MSIQGARTWFPTARERPEGVARLEPVVALALVLVTGARIGVGFGLTLGLLAMVAFAPVWARHLRHYRGAVTLVSALLLAIASGLWLSARSAGSHTVVLNEVVSGAATVLTVLLGVVAFLWARRFHPDWLVATAFALGMFLAIRPSENFASNAWRFGFSWPVTILALALLSRQRSRRPEIVGVAVLAAVSGVAGGRSPFAVMCIVLLLVLWQVRAPARSRGLAVVRGIVLGAGLAYAVYVVAQEAVLAGYLGADAQARSELQIERSGSLILGGRPEAAATWALFRADPVGFGFGIRPSAGDIAVAKSGMISINYDPENNYVEQYLFGNVFELHSVVGDFWAWMGLAGVLLVLVFVIFVAVRISVLVAEREASALVLFVSIMTMWNVFFGPALTSVPIAVLCLGLLLPRSTVDPVSSGGEGDRERLSPPMVRGRTANDQR
ncbi:hypothetical protein IF650_10030 [Cellulosimicrobium terreum]|nr:hypothetical protein [Cellulosimicrobium terreum]